VSVVGFRANNHPQQTRRRGPRPDVDDRATDPVVFGPLHDHFRFTLDAAASAANAKCERFYSIEQDGLTQSWAGESVWVNPPYSDIEPWVRKAWHEFPATQGIVMLLPANRTEQGWWQRWVEPYRDRTDGVLRTEFLSGRLRFLRNGATKIGPNERPPFGCCLLIWQAIR
jgi:phage N-6-adenine-methyltransferase